MVRAGWSSVLGLAREGTAKPTAAEAETRCRKGIAKMMAAPSQQVQAGWTANDDIDFEELEKWEGMMMEVEDLRAMRNEVGFWSERLNNYQLAASKHIESLRTTQPNLGIEPRNQNDPNDNGCNFLSWAAVFPAVSQLSRPPPGHAQAATFRDPRNLASNLRRSFASEDLTESFANCDSETEGRHDVMLPLRQPWCLW